MRTSWVWLAASALLLSMGTIGACGTDAMATDACRKIEQARCRKAPACPDLTVQSGTGVEECVQFARDRCLHGLAFADPGVAAVDQCVSAIDRTTSCDLVADPSSLAACTFLNPTAAGPDAGLDATEGASDGAPSEATSIAPEASVDGG